MYWKIPFSHTCWQILIYIWCHDKVSFADWKEGILTEIFWITCSTWMQPEWGSIRIILLVWYRGLWVPHFSRNHCFPKSHCSLKASMCFFPVLLLPWVFSLSKLVARSQLQPWEVRLLRVSRPAFFSFCSTAAVIKGPRSPQTASVYHQLHHMIARKSKAYERHNCNTWPLSKVERTKGKQRESSEYESLGNDEVNLFFNFNNIFKEKGTFCLQSKSCNLHLTSKKWLRWARLWRWSSDRYLPSLLGQRLCSRLLYCLPFFFQAAEPFLLKGLFGLGPLKAHVISSAGLCFLSLSLWFFFPFSFFPLKPVLSFFEGLRCVSL